MTRSNGTLIEATVTAILGRPDRASVRTPVQTFIDTLASREGEIGAGQHDAQLRSIGPRSPALSTMETSFWPSSQTTKPNPLSALNHFTVPSMLIAAAGSGRSLPDDTFAEARAFAREPAPVLASTARTAMTCRRFWPTPTCTLSYRWTSSVPMLSVGPAMIPTSPMRRRPRNPRCVAWVFARDERGKDGEGRGGLGYLHASGRSLNFSRVAGVGSGA